MGGTNPYIPAPKVTKAQKPFRVTFRGDKDVVVNVDPAKIPFGETGLAGSILDIALNNGVEIDHACGGVCACSTCHIYVVSGGDTCSEAMDSEHDMLDLAPDVRPNSRLACQSVPNGEKDIIVEIPSWNRNLVREGH